MGKARQGFIALATTLAMAAATGPGAAQSVAGATEFTRSCASCHGLTGRGDGALAEYMTIPVPDLTRISARNGGEFPMLRVIHLIDGRSGLRGHGGPMPIWGDRFEAAVIAQRGDVGTEIAVRGRILALATYLEAIQQ